MKLAAKIDDLVAKNTSASDYERKSEGSGSNNGILGSWSTMNRSNVVDKHIDVHEDEGWITIPCKELPDGWIEQSDLQSIRSLDRPFIFPGEQVHILATLSTNALRKEEDRTDTQKLFKRLKNSHFFARIAESDEALWSRRKTDESVQGSKSTVVGNFLQIESSNDMNKTTHLDRTSPDTSTSGGVAKNDVKCSLLPTGDIVVLLQVNIGVDFLHDPVIEIVQFEKHQSTTTTSLTSSQQDPYGDLLKWLLPVKNSILPPSLLSETTTPNPNPNPNPRTSLTKPKSPTPNSFGSQNFLFGHFRSHSMSSIPSKGRPNVCPDDWNRFASSSSNCGSERNGDGGGQLSFRGVLLEPDRFSVRCGLEGIYIPGRRWRRKIEIIKPLQIRCFAAECNTQDLLSVQIKNVCPSNAPDIVIYLDSITVIKDGHTHPSYLPVTCIEAGSNHGLPGVPLRKGEEHSFILKPSTTSYCNGEVERSYDLGGSVRSSVFNLTNMDRGVSLSHSNGYALLISCRSNYTESRLFFKQPINWQPTNQKDILISVISQTLKHDNTVSHLPIQVLTLEASNLTNEGLNITLLAPPSSTSSMVSLHCSPMGMTLFDERVSNDGFDLERMCLVSNVMDERCRVDSVAKSEIDQTHMWLKSKVPLGFVPARSRVTVKLELLPLTDGIITLDSLQINVERGISYVPEYPLKINARSPINTDRNNC